MTELFRTEGVGRHPLAQSLIPLLPLLEIRLRTVHGRHFRLIDELKRKLENHYHPTEEVGGRPRSSTTPGPCRSIRCSTSKPRTA